MELNLPSKLTIDDLPIFANLLPQLTDHNPAIQKPAEQQISRLSKVPGFCSLLLEVVANKTVPEPLRVISIILVKNAIENQWTSRRLQNSDGITEAEKEVVRNSIFLLLDEPSQVVAIHIALIMGKLARIDFGPTWPDLITRLFKIIQESNPCLRLRGLLCLHHVQLSLRSRCLMEGKRMFKQVAPEIFQFVVNILQNSINIILGALSEFRNFPLMKDRLEQLKPEAEGAKLSLKVIHGLLLQGYNEWTDENGVIPFLRMMLERWDNIITIRTSLPEHPLSLYLLNYERQFGKIIIDTQQYHPLNWSPILAPCLQFCLTVLRNFDINEKQEKLIINCMTFIKQVILCEQYEKGTQARQVVIAFTQPGTVQELLVLLVCKYLVLTVEDLTEWREKPEVFVHEEDMDAYTERRRPMAENLSLVLVKEFKAIAAPILLQMLKETSQPGQNLSQILLKDACYSVVCWGAFELYDKLDFPSWFTNQLIPELQNNDTNFKIIHRRIAQILGQWVTNVTPEIRKTVYSVLATLLGHSDLVISLTASSSLTLVVKDMEFKLELFMPFLDQTVINMFRLIRTCESNDTKLGLLDVLGNLVEEMGGQMRPYTNQFLELASGFWQQSVKDHMMKLAVIRLLEKLVKVLGENYSFQHIFVPVIEHSVDVSSPDSIYLLADGLDLWLSTLRQADSMAPPLLALFGHIIRVLNINYEHVIVAMKIIGCYVILGNHVFILMHLNDLAQLFHRMIGDVKDPAAIATLRPIEMLLLLYPKETPMILDNVLQKIFSLLLQPQESTRIKIYYLSVFTRLIMHNFEYFLSFIDRMNNNPANINANNLLTLYIPLALDKIDNMPERSRRKATLMSLLNILVFRQDLYTDPVIFDHLVHLVIASIGIIQDEDAGQGPEVKVRPDLAIEDDEELYFSEVRSNTLHMREWRMVYKKDPVNCITMSQFLTEKLRELQVKNPQLTQRLMQSIPLPITHHLRL